MQTFNYMTTAAFEKAFEGAIQYSHLDVLFKPGIRNAKKIYNFWKIFNGKQLE